MESRVIQLTPAAHKYGNLNIRPCGLDFFPPDAFGGPSRKGGLGVPITLKVEGLPNPIETDIPKDKTGKPRWLFRERAWVKRFIAENNLTPGDTISINRLNQRIYEVAPTKNGPKRRCETTLRSKAGKPKGQILIIRKFIIVGVVFDVYIIRRRCHN